MTMLPILYAAWATFAVLLFTLLVYRSTLTRYEDDKLFLDGLDTYGQNLQTEIVRKVNRMAPIVHTIGIATGAVTVGIVGVHVYRAILVLQS
ncbi:hypothetical protein [Granulicella arctica]|uniref:hypothetical protein n=1 Tax=Granulicella arctica TaxID=940613 RepID=UPI0021DF460D|nr:hypothetical protein [Granulicella arctica]